MLGFIVVVGMAILAPTVIRAVGGGDRYPNTPAGRDQKAKDGVFTYWMFIGAAVVFGGLFFLGNLLVVLGGIAMLVMGWKNHS